MDVLTETEKVRRREFMRSAKAAVAQGLTIEAYNAKHEDTVREWCEWLHAEMDKLRCDDPAEVLPQAMARLEERVAAEARNAAKQAAQAEVRSMLARAIR